MRFKDWLLIENIVVKWGRDNAILQPSNEVMPFDVHYQWDKGFSSYFVGAFQAQRVGYVSIGTRATHIGIIKTTPIESNSGPDFGFIKNLIGIIRQQRLIPVPYKEEGSDFDGMFKKAEKDLGKSLNLDDIKTGFATGENLPDFELGQSSTHQLTKGMSVSRATGSWAQFFETNQATYLLPKIVEFLKQAAKPLLDNDIIDFIEIVS